MGNLRFRKNDAVRVEDRFYIVLGYIEYENTEDGCHWMEYCLRDRDTNEIKWLSIDTQYEEYAIYTRISYNSDMENQLNGMGYHLADSGTEKVISYDGNMDVDIGETAGFLEYEDDSEENIISVEAWSDEKEYARGYYVDREDIRLADKSGWDNSGTKRNTGDHWFSSFVKKLLNGIFLFFVAIFVLLGIRSIFGNNKLIRNYLEKSTDFELCTGITSEYDSGEKALVYSTALTLDEAVKNILDGIEGNTERVQQNTEDGDLSVAIVTTGEYCLVYESKKNEVLVQVSSRAYVYGSDNEIYHGTCASNRYYRRYYYSTAYLTDRNHYKKKKDSYAGYDDTTIDSSYNDTYNDYASSIRQSSVSSRRSSGGGTGYGK